MTIALYARRQKWPLESVEIRLTHSRDHVKDCEKCVDKDMMLDRIDSQVKLAGPLTAEQRAKLLDVGQRCPVHRTLKSGIHMTAVGV